MILEHHIERFLRAILGSSTYLRSYFISWNSGTQPPQTEGRLGDTAGLCSREGFAHHLTVFTTFVTKALLNLAHMYHKCLGLCFPRAEIFG